MSEPKHWMSGMKTQLGPNGWEIVPSQSRFEEAPSTSIVEKPLSPPPTDGPQGFLTQAHIMQRWPGPSLPVRVTTTPTCLYQRDPDSDVGTEAILLRNLGIQDVYIGSLEDLHQDTRSGLLLRGGDARTGRPHELYLASPPPLIFGVTQSSNTTVMVVPF